MSSSLLYPRMTVSRRVESLDGYWRFQFDPKRVGVEAGWTKALPESISMPVPSSFNDLFTDKDSREYCGDFWYETDFFVPGEWQGKDIVIRFGSVSYRARVFVNGTELTSHVGGFLPFNADATEVVKYNAMNRLSVLANNELSETMIPCGTTAVLSNGKKMNRPYFDFFAYAGIHRPVKVLALPKERVEDYSVVRRMGEDGKFYVDYTVKTNGESDVKVVLKDAEGREVAESSGKTGTLAVSDPHLWDVHQGYLYTIDIAIMDGGTVVDEYYDTLGLRTFEIKDGHFLLNGHGVYLKGFGRHEDADIRGKGLDLATLKRDYELMNWIGANSFRTSHYPYAEEAYYLADEYGILVIDEVPAVGLFESLMNAVDASKGNAKQVHWFEKETTPELLAHHKDCVDDMINRDKNHASVIAWSLLNEPETIYECATPYFEEVFALAKEVDPEKRPRTFAMIMNSTPDKCKCWHLCDFLALNRYYGWYVMGGYQIVDAEAMFMREMKAWGEILGDRPMMFTEYGADTLASEHKLPSVMWAQEYQDEYLEMTHRVFDSFSFIKGEQVWNFADFQTTEGIIRVNGNKKGIFTRERQPKSAAYVFKKRWESLPVDYKC